MTPPRRATRTTTGLAALALAAGVLVAAPTSAAVVDPVDGALTSGDRVFPNQGNGGYDALHYDLDLSVDVTPSAVPGSLATTTIPGAVTTMTARTTGAPLRSFGLDLQGLRVGSVRVDGRPAAFERIEVTDVDDPTKDVHKLVVTPRTPVDGEFTTVIRYSGTPVSHTDADGSSEGWNNTVDGATFVNQPVGAMTGFPHNDTPADKATYDIALDVPTTITTTAGPGAAAGVSNGELVDEIASSDGLRTTWAWEQSRPMASELVIISVGRYDVRRSSITLSDGRVIPEWSFLDSALSAANKQRLDDRRAQIGEITRGLEKVFGPYPGGSTGIVVDTVPRSISYALETQDRSFFPTVGSVLGDTLTHEIAHQWFGNHVAPVTWNDIWINEGMASWVPGHYNNQLASPPLSSRTTETAQFGSWASGVPADYAVPPASFTDAADLYGYQTYARSAQMWEALKGSIGDVAFFAFVREWQDRFGGGSHGTADFTALAEEVSGRDLDAFFQDWLRDADKPAWVQRWTPTLSTDTASAASGDVVTWTLSAANIGTIPLTSSVGTVDLSDVLVRADLGVLPDGLTLQGTTLTWAVPTTEVGQTSTVSFTTTARYGDLTAALVPATLGGVCAAACSTTVSVPGGPITPPITPPIGLPGPPVTSPPVLTPPAAPALSPSVRGKTRPGRTLRVRPLAVPAGSTVTHRWKVGGRTVATSPRLRIRPSYVGKRVVLVTVVTRPGQPALRTRTPLGRVRTPS